MIRKHLALSIALASILSLVAGGLAYAALAPNTKVTACVTSDGFVRSASYSNKCPYRSTAITLPSSADLQKIHDDQAALRAALQRAESDLAALRTPPETVTASATVRAGESAHVYARCPDGKYVTDGGFTFSVRANIQVSRAVAVEGFRSDGFLNEYVVTVTSQEEYGHSEVRAHAICSPKPRQ